MLCRHLTGSLRSNTSKVFSFLWFGAILSLQLYNCLNPCVHIDSVSRICGSTSHVSSFPENEVERMSSPHHHDGELPNCLLYTIHSLIWHPHGSIPYSGARTISLNGRANHSLNTHLLSSYHVPGTVLNLQSRITENLQFGHRDT